MSSHTIKVGGVCCSHCDHKIKKAISQVDGVSEVDFDNNTHEAFVNGNFDVVSVEGAVTDLGYFIVK